MMDLENLFSESQAVTGTAISTNIINLGNANRDIGVGYPSLKIEITVTEAVTGGTGLDVNLLTKADSSFASGTTELETLVTIPAAAPIGSQYLIPISPASGQSFLQYIGLQYDPVGADLTAGKFTAAVVETGNRSQSYPNAYNT